MNWCRMSSSEEEESDSFEVPLEGLYREQTFGRIASELKPVSPSPEKKDTKLPDDITPRRATILTSIDSRIVFSLRRMASSFETTSTLDELRSRETADPDHDRRHSLDTSTTLPSVEIDRPYAFPVKDLTIARTSYSKLDFSIFKNVTDLAEGTSAEVSKANLLGDEVVIKMIRPSKSQDPTALLEFDIELGILGRLSKRIVPFPNHIIFLIIVFYQ